MTLLMRSLFLCLFLVSCAKPNYQDLTPQAQESTPQGEKPTQDEDSQNSNPQDPAPEKCKLFFGVEHLCMRYEWVTKPTDTVMGVMELKFYVQEKPTEFVDPKNSVFLMLWMPSMGHGSRPVTIEKTKTGVYKASKMSFYMKGEWEIKFQLREGTSVTDEVAEKINI